jgi:hypothetical protein
MIALRRRIENLEYSQGKNRKWDHEAIAKDLGIPVDEVKNCNPGMPQNHDMVAIAAQFGIDLGLYEKK